MNPVTAMAIRRAATTAAALSATLVAHMLGGAGWTLLPIAPLIWLSVVLLAFPLSVARRAPGGFAPRSPGEVLAVLLVAQAATHLLMTTAPWAFGIAGHHHGWGIGLAALVAHGCAAVLLTVLMCFGERLLAAAIQVMRALIASPVRPGSARPALRIAGRRVVLPAGPGHDPRTSRGPPYGRLVPAGAFRR